MQSYTITDQQLDLIKLINEQRNEPIILKNNSGKNFLVMPFSTQKVQDISLMFYKSFNELSSIEPNNLIKHEEEPKMTATEFTKKWLGFMKDTISESYKEEYYEFLNKKYK